MTIVDVHYLPVSSFVSNYLTIHISGRSFDTKHQYAKQLKSVLNHFKSKNINIEARVESGQFFEVTELQAFYEYCKFKVTSKFSKVVKITKYTDKTLENAMHAKQVAESLVQAKTAKDKIKRFKDFIGFINTHTHLNHIAPAEVLHRYSVAKEYLDGCLENLKDFNKDCVGEEESSIPTEKFLQLLEIIKPESPDNPFKRSKFRNYLIVQLYTETGNRRGDHAGLKIGDMKFDGTFDELSIVRRPNDPTDSRPFKPSTKTKGHKSFAPKSLMTEVKRYIDDVRTRYSESSKHTFIFVTENNSKGTIGKPLSLSAINKIFEKLSERIGFNIHCHLLRSKFNEILTDIAKHEGLSHDETDKMRKYMMGWSDNSDMAEIYNRFKIYEGAREINALRQAQMTAPASEEKEAP